jgi:hypothetical protein
MPMTMSTLPPDSSPGEVDQHLSFTNRRLSAYTLTAACAAEGKAALATLRADALAERDATETRLAVAAELVALTEELFASVPHLSRAALVVVKNDRADPRYALAFPKPVSEVLDGAISNAKVAYVEVALTALAAEPSFTSLAPHIAEVQAHLDAVKAARLTHAAAVVAERAAEAKLKVTAAAARDLYNTFFHEVTLLYPKRKGFVRSFFMQRRKRASVDEQVP